MDSNIDDNIWVLDIVYDGLMRYDPETTEPYPYVAESVDTTDNQVWTIKIKPDLTFQNGEPVDAAAFARAWNYAAYGPNAMQNNYFFERFQGYDEMQGETDDDGNVTVEPAADTLSGVKVVDDLTLEVTLNAPFAGFSTMLGYTGFFPDCPGVHRRHRRLRPQADRQRPVPDRRVAAGGEPHRQQVGRLHPRRDAELRHHRVDRVRRGIELARLPGRRPRHRLPAVRRAGRRRRRRRPAVALRRTARRRAHLPRLPAVPRGSLAGRRSSARRSRWRSTARASSTP